MLEIFGGQNFLAYGERNLPAINVGLGLEIAANDKSTILCGIRTDMNYNQFPYYTFQQLSVEASKWHLIHSSLGLAKQTKGGKTVTAGLEYTMNLGGGFYQFVNFTNPKAKDLMMGQRQPNATIRQHGFKIVLGVEIGKENGKPSIE